MHDNNTKNCKICGKVFSHPHNEICPECAIKDEIEFQKVRAFLKEFPRSKASIIEEYTGVSHKRILRYLREERLELAESSPDFLNCAKCGKPIKKGMYCSECYRKFMTEVNKIFSTIEKETKAKMHITINMNNY